MSKIARNSNKNKQTTSNKQKYSIDSQQNSKQTDNNRQ